MASGVRHDEMYENEVAICGTTEEPLPLVVTTDGHASRYGAVAIKAMIDNNIRPSIREGGSSWITQMFDQIFQYFNREYTRHGEQFIKRWSHVRKDPYDQFKMHEDCVVAIIAEMHPGAGNGDPPPPPTARAHTHTRARARTRIHKHTHTHTHTHSGMRQCLRGRFCFNCNAL
jgi:hypothetical protein